MMKFVLKSTVIHNLALIWIFFVLISRAATDEEANLRSKAENYGTPITDPPATEFTAEAREDFRIPCLCSSPITWVTIDPDHHTIDHNLHVEYSVNDTSRFPYQATLVLHGVSVDDVHFYYCVQNRSLQLAENLADIENEVKLFRGIDVYLFVKDEEHPLVPLRNPAMSVKQYEPYTIPCKPAHRDVEVELIRWDQEPSNVLNAAKFDPKLGFTVKFREIHDSAWYACRVKGVEDGEEHPFEISLLPTSRTEYITSPQINSTSESGFVYIDSPITLYCFVEIKAGVKYDILWYFKGRQISKQDQQKYEISDISEHPSQKALSTIGTRSLTILQAALEDSGNYRCSVRDHNNNENEHTYTVKVLEKDQSELELRASQTKLETPKGTTVTIMFEYTSYPDAKFEIYKNADRLILDDNFKLEPNYKERRVIFKIFNAQIENTANYTLSASNGVLTKNSTVQVFVTGPPFIQLEPEVIYAKLGQKIMLLCKSISYPPATFEWSYRKCEVSEWDRCSLTRGGTWVSNDLLLALLKNHSSILNNSRDTFSLTNNPIFTSNLKPNTSTIVRNARFTDNTQFDTNESLRDMVERETSELIYMKTANLTAFIRFPGVARCIAENHEGPPDTKSAVIMVGHMEKPAMLWRQNEGEIISEEDDVKLECGAIKYNYSNLFRWRHAGKFITNETNEYDFENNDTQYEYRSVLTIKNADMAKKGQYSCITYNKATGQRANEMTYFVDVKKRKQARITATNLTSYDNVVSLGDSVQLFCDVEGIPPPEIEWTKDGVLLTNETLNLWIGKEGDRSILRITAVKVDHEGEYRCKVENKDGMDAQSTKLVIKNRPFKYLLHTTIGVFIFILFLTICTIYLCIRVKKEKDKVAALKKIGLYQFEEGDIDRLNPDLDLTEQADLLPYDRRFEFPRDKLKLGQQLGAGAFGVVVKGIAQGIIPYEEESTVAVKMVKANTDDEIMRALISELKIMVHLGQHLNVVNLLGAVTKNIARREVMVIVEYCRFGNVQKFLLKHRTSFVDQIKKDTDEIDPTILENEYRWSNNSVYNISTGSHNSCGNGKLGVKYMNVRFPNESNYYNVTSDRASNSGFNPSGHINSQGYVRHSGFAVDSANTEATLLSRGDESERPLSSGYQSEYRGPVRNVTTSDLVCWSFQVARGMDYLASRKVLHGDLAARNILLCDNNIVKICDFGLARSLYNNENYKKNNETPLPFKWLALESLSDQVFSTYSDVWAFGVTMWEFFSLAQTPYPGIDPNRDLYLKLMAGYRMEKPKYANQRLYDIMLSCWNQKPETRPLFNQLEKQLSALLEDGVKDHYIDLNEPYLQANTEYLKSNPDYLAMLGPPDEMAPPIPSMIATHEEFHPPNVEAPSVPGYINMQPMQGTAIYTPNAVDEDENDASQPLNKKTSPVQKPPRKSKERQIRSSDDDGPGEDIPMLEKNPNNNKFEGNHEGGLMPRHPRDTIESNQYVNVPSQKQQDAFSNPSYVVVNNVNERN
ncbi:vascular endothelial growth factor receptor kdr-like isoform X2 [Culicoides brevitarsis]|uniref:vascular endothelial growth factor receptor kdr-like isoform X2 n=1 Tax=Culicoides brevitarsis TaxID=469753 RepID=UPI00307BBF14